MPYLSDQWGRMNPHGPGDPALVVQEKMLLFHPNRDSWFPYLYEIAIHHLVQLEGIEKNGCPIKRIIAYMQDTSKEALEEQFAFESLVFVFMTQAFEGASPELNEIGNQILPDEMHEVKWK